MYRYTFVINRKDLETVKELSKFYNKKPKLEYIDDRVVRVLLFDKNPDYRKKQKELLELADKVGINVLISGVQCNGQTILIN